MNNIPRSNVQRNKVDREKYVLLTNYNLSPTNIVIPDQIHEQKQKKANRLGYVAIGAGLTEAIHQIIGLLT